MGDLMKRFFNNIKKYFKYSIYSAKAELKSEVADSYLNCLWWIIEPVCFMLIYTFVFGVVFKNSEHYFASFVFIGLTAWEFFNRMISGSVKLIINNRDLVTKVYLPKYILLLSKSFTYIFKTGISLLIAFILMICQGVPFTWHIILLIPIFFFVTKPSIPNKTRFVLEKACQPAAFRRRHGCGAAMFVSLWFCIVLYVL